MNLFIYCAGGFGKEVVDSVRRYNSTHMKWNEIYFIDDSILHNRDYYGTKVFDLNYVLRNFKLNEVETLIANGEPAIKKALFDKLSGYNINFAIHIDGSAIISETAHVKKGVIILGNCFVSSCAVLDNNTALNTNSLIGHDSVIKENTVISTAVNIGGNCSIGANSYIGMGAQIKQGVKIGDDVIIGMGSIVQSDIPDGVIALGNPARPMRHNEKKEVFKK